MRNSLGALAAAATVATGMLPGCIRTNDTPPNLTPFVVYAETDDIAAISNGECCDPPTRLDLEMIPDGGMLFRCDDFGGELIWYAPNFRPTLHDPHLPGHYYCEDVDY